MKILHCCLCWQFAEHYNYQENLLAMQNRMDGHQVFIVSTTQKMQESGVSGRVLPSQYMEDGVYIQRIPYRWMPSKFLQEKINSYIGFEKLAMKIRPDVIMFHGTNAYELLTLKKIKTQLPKTKIYIDSHSSFYNSARNLLSKYVLHKLFYANILKSILPYIEKIFYVAYDCKTFLTDLYHIDEKFLEYYPLGGVILDEHTRFQKRNAIRGQYNLKENDLLLIHSGKMEKAKKTYELVQALHATKADNLKLLIIGSMTDDVASAVMPVVNADPRIEYLGWKSGEELMDYLCAADLYVQPGTQSATMQNALCCGSAAALFPYESHKFLLGDSVFYIETIDDMAKLFSEISKDRSLLEAKRKNSNKIARERLDYKVLAARLYQ